MDDGWIGGWMDVWMDVWMNGWMDSGVSSSFEIIRKNISMSKHDPKHNVLLLNAPILDRYIFCFLNLKYIH